MNPLLPLFRRAALGFAVVLAPLATFAASANVLIRVPAGRPQPPELAPLLAQWQQSGQVSHALLLTRGRAENPQNPGRRPQFETFVVLEFPDENSAESWQRGSAPSLPAGLIVRRADALVHGELPPRDRNRSVFIVNTYTPTVPAARFREFVQGYIAPLYAAM